MDALTGLVDLLQRGGPWTITAVCMLIVQHLYRELRATQRESAKDKQELNDRLINMTAKQVEVLTISNENQRDLIEAVKLLEE